MDIRSQLRGFRRRWPGRADGCSEASAGAVERVQNDCGGDLPNRLTTKIAAVGSVVLYDLRRESDADVSNDVVGGPDIAIPSNALLSRTCTAWLDR